MESKNPATNSPTSTPAKPELKKGLGRGLAALLGGDEESPFSRLTATQSAKDLSPDSRADTAEIEPGGASNFAGPYRIMTLPIEKVRPNSDQPRQHFSDAKLQELADSICEQGLIQPIVVRTMPDQNYQIVAGERRWRACKMLGMTEIPAIIREDSEQSDKTDLASIIENIQRVELNPIELAEAYSKIITSYNFTQDELAKKLGVSRVSVANTLRLQKLPAGVKEALIEGKISEGHARALLPLEAESEVSRLLRQILEQGLNVRAVESLVRDKTQGPGRSPETSAAPREPTAVASLPELPSKSPETLAAEEELRGIFGTKAVIKGNTKGGMIELYYSNEDSLHRLLHQLRSARA